MLQWFIRFAEFTEFPFHLGKTLLSLSCTLENKSRFKVRVPRFAEYLSTKVLEWRKKLKLIFNQSLDLLPGHQLRSRQIQTKHKHTQVNIMGNMIVSIFWRFNHEAMTLIPKLDLDKILEQNSSHTDFHAKLNINLSTHVSANTYEVCGRKFLMWKIQCAATTEAVTFRFQK